MKKMLKADLHIHTTMSDGYLTPDELLLRLRNTDIGCISVTDHDSVAAIDVLNRRASMFKIRIIPGVELSAEFNGRDLHFLGYFINHHSKRFLDYLYLFGRRRFQRAQEMIDLLEKMGINISIDKVAESARNGPIGRPHLADMLIQGGWVKTRDEAFEKYLGNDGPVYVEKYRITAGEVISLIHSIGGAAFIAHPALQCDDKIIKELAKEGLDGIEVMHPKHTPEDIRHFTLLAKKLKLLTSGGSDFHGDPNSDIKLGDYFIDETKVNRIEEYCISKRAEWNIKNGEDKEATEGEKSENKK